MFLTLDNLAKKYGLLPSEVLVRASTFDLFVLDISAKWDVYQNDLAEGRTVKHALTQEQMQAMLARARSAE
jgi:hypothetical protein